MPFSDYRSLFRLQARLPLKIYYGMCLIFYPFKSVRYFITYHRIVSSLIDPNGSSAIKKAFTALNAVLVYQAAHFLYLAFRSDTFTDYQHTLHHDGVRMLAGAFQRAINGFGCAAVLIVIQYYQCIGPGRRNAQLIPIIAPFLSLSKTNRKVSGFLYSKYKNRPIDAVIRNFYLLVLNLFQSILMSEILMIIYQTSIFGYKLFVVYYDQLCLPNIYFLILKLLFFLFNLFAYRMFFIAMTHAFAIYFSTASTLVFVLFIRLAHTNRYFRRNCFKSPIAFHIFNREFKSGLRLLFRLNRAYSDCFAIQVFAALPLNSSLVSYLLSGRVQWPAHIFVAAAIVYQANCIFIVHLGLTRCTANIHRHSRLMFRLSAVMRRAQFGLRNRLKLTHEIFAFHTDRRYGFTYGSFGLITLAAFFRFLMLYAKFMMIAHKFTHG